LICLKLVLDNIAAGLFEEDIDNWEKEYLNSKKRCNYSDNLFHLIVALKCENKDIKEGIEYSIYEFSSLERLNNFALVFFR